MATPWAQAQDFVRTNWRKIKMTSKGQVPTRPLDVLNKVAQAWTSDNFLQRMPVPAWVFLYSPTGNGLYEWVGNRGDIGLGRSMIGFAKLNTIKTAGGMVFLGAWHERRLHVPALAVARKKWLFVFDKLDTEYRLLTERQWERYAELEIED
jgi:hypothetical protein